MTEKFTKKFTKRFARALRRMIDQYRSRGSRMSPNRRQNWWQPAPVPALVPARGMR